jgi:hypothetical protein
MDTMDIYRIFHFIATDYTFSSAADGTFTKIDHILGHKANIDKYKKIKNSLYPNRPSWNKIRNK